MSNYTTIFSSLLNEVAMSNPHPHIPAVTVDPNASPEAKVTAHAEPLKTFFDVLSWHFLNDDEAKNTLRIEESHKPNPSGEVLSVSVFRDFEFTDSYGACDAGEPIFIAKYEVTPQGLFSAFFKENSSEPAMVVDLQAAVISTLQHVMENNHVDVSKLIPGQRIISPKVSKAIIPSFNTRRNSAFQSFLG